MIDIIKADSVAWARERSCKRRRFPTGCRPG